MLGNRMKQLRLSKKITLEELASRLNERYPDTVNFNKGKLSKWENGKEEPKLSSMRILADYYNTSIDSFYDEDFHGDQLAKIIDDLEDYGVNVEVDEDNDVLTLSDKEDSYTIPLSTMYDLINQRIYPKFLQELEKDKLIFDLTSEKSLLFKISELSEQLSKNRQEKIYTFAKEQLEEQKQENVLDFPKKEKIRTIHNSASAANPTELAYGDTVVEEEEFERVPRNADFAVPIIGDSMEPVIRNGQFVFVKEQPDVEDGEIAIVELDGDGVTCKEIYKDYEKQIIILHSLNELYEDRIISPEKVRIIGKVVF